MSLYGALFGGVSGLKAQSSKIGAISDNIANVNTVGYKQAQATFQTLVVNSNSATSYQTGGVRGGTRLAVSKQGLLSSTDAPTDIAISGGGFFVVRSTADAADASDASALPLFTRAGSFRQDSLGNFLNSQGFYLQGWPLDREGNLPGEGTNPNATSASNFDSLETVNVESASGVAQATTLLELGANLDAGEEIFPGESVTGEPDTRATVNANINAEAVILGDEYGFAQENNLHRGDMFEVESSGNIYSYLYGGFTVGRDVTTIGGGANFGDGHSSNTALTAITGAGDVEFVGGGSTFIVNIPNHGLIDGDNVTLSGAAGAFFGGSATPTTQINTTHTITRIDANSFSITVATPHGQASGNVAAQPLMGANTRQFNGNVLNATSAGTTFLGGSTPASTFTASALTFTVSTATTGARTFSYVTTSPNTLNGQFNNMTTLAQAINDVTGLTARVANGRLVVSSEDPSEAVTFANGDAAGAVDGTRRGIDWVTELGVADVPAPSAFPGTSTFRFNSMASLANLINASDGISATVLNPLSAASIEIRTDDPSTTIALRDVGIAPTTVTAAGTPVSIPAGTFVNFIDITINDVPPAGLAIADYVSISGLGVGGLPFGFPNGSMLDVVTVNPGNYTVRYPIPAGVSVTTAGGNFAAPAGNHVSVVGDSNSGSILGALSILDTSTGVDNTALIGTYTTPLETGDLGPRYDAAGVNGDNMASGDITPQFSRNIRLYDGLGAGHDIRFSFIKTALNQWAVEIHAIPPGDVQTTEPNGQIAAGRIIFNGDGSLFSVDPSLIPSTGIGINWTNGASSSTINLDLGTAGQPFGTTGATVIGLTDGLSQFDSSYNVSFANQNGAPVGQLVSVAINEDGQIIASYSNGETQALYQLPIADFANPDGMRAITGNVYAQTRESGEVNLREAGTNGTGTVVSAALEQSNVDLAEQLTDMIVAQRAYQANTRVIRTTDELLEQLNQL